MNRRAGRLARILLAGSGWLALASMQLPAESLVRPVAAFAFILFCPGAAILGVWLRPAPVDRLILSFAFSASISTLVAEGLIMAGAWSVPLALTLLATLTTGAAVWGLKKDQGGRRLSLKEETP